MISQVNHRGSATEGAKKQRHLKHSPVEFHRLVHAAGSVIQTFVKDIDAGCHRHLVGYYDTDHLPQLVRDAMQFSGQAAGIYYGLNPVHPACLDRAKNCLQPSSQATSAKNSDILRRHLMLIDIDPVREPNFSATHEEKEVAYWLGRIICRDLRKAGWPMPIVVDSGNGYHLLYRIDLPVEDEDLIRNCLKALASKYDCDVVKVDTGVFDARRIAKLPGTMACKGLSSGERPHRQSGFFRLPHEFKTVPAHLIAELADRAPSKANRVASQIPAPIEGAVQSKQIASARAYLAKMLPAVSGQNGRNQFLNAACRLVDDFALPRAQALMLLNEFNQRCVPPFDSRGVDDKLSSALAKVTERGGPSGSALKGFTKESPPNPARKFIGFVPDFGLTNKHDALASLNTQYISGFWVWYWLLWSSLRSDVYVPDVMLRQWNWGAKHDKNWKVRLKKKVKLQSVNTADCSADRCMLYGTGVRHDHYSLALPRYGLLDRFGSQEEQQPGGLRIFDVYGPTHEELRKKLQSEGQLYNVYWPALVLGSSPKVGWSRPQQRLIVGMVLELTRTKREPADDIAGEIISGGRVAASKNTYLKTVCPLLDPKNEYVSFSGNGKRKGRGYQLVGRTGKGWIYRVGYLDAPEMNAVKRFDALKSFLKNLEFISKDLGLIPAAISHGKWKNLDEMIDCTHTGRGRDWLESCTMRIYAPADWRYRWRIFFSEKMGFQWIPASTDDSGTSFETAQPRTAHLMTSANQIKRWLRDLKWTQQRLADEIADVTGRTCSVRRVQRHLSGESCTPSFFAAVDRVNAALKSDTETH